MKVLCKIIYTNRKIIIAKSKSNFVFGGDSLLIVEKSVFSIDSNVTPRYKYKSIQLFVLEKYTTSVCTNNTCTNNDMFHVKNTGKSGCKALFFLSPRVRRIYFRFWAMVKITAVTIILPDERLFGTSKLWRHLKSFLSCNRNLCFKEVNRNLDREIPMITPQTSGKWRKRARNSEISYLKFRRGQHFRETFYVWVRHLCDLLVL